MSVHHGDGASLSSIVPVSAPAPAFPALLANAKKRKRDAVDETDLDRRPFAIRNPTDPFAKPATYAPVCILSRAQLPLAYLDTAQPGSRLFQAHIRIFEDYRDSDDDDDAVVLVAAEEKEKRLYAIERVQKRTYALCRLQQIVTEDEVLARAKCVVRRDEQQQKRRAVQSSEQGAPWWTKAAIDLPTEVKSGNLPALVMRRVMDAPQKVSSAHGSQTQPSPNLDSVVQQDAEIETAKSPEQVLEELAKHYMDALYISRTSLAYFTKGPFSRARVLFSSHGDNAKPENLIEFVRQSILSSTTLDKKYRETIAELVKDLPASTLESPEDVAKRKKKKTKKWKDKRSKAGFFVGEDDYVERWWRAEETLGSPETVEAALKRRVPGLRMRETFLQITLVMEVLALEASTTGKLSVADAHPAADSESQTKDTQGETAQPDSAIKHSKPKKRQDLSALLETLLDKLCIWHALEAHSPTKLVIGRNQEDANDALKSFCIEVVVPFYVSRIPQYAALVNKRLGGPTPPSPKRHDASTSRKPGEPAVRKPPEKKLRQPLKRVSTDIHNRRDRQPPSLMRSATDTDAMNIKREPSMNPSLGSIPTADKAAQPRRRRPELLEQLNAKQRAIDITAMSKASEANLRKRTERLEATERMKAEAISGIKKPNRALAVKETADSVDERVSLLNKKSARPQQRPRKAIAEVSAEHTQAWSITATPSRFASRQIGMTPHNRRRTAPAAPEHGSAESIVPSSSARLLAPPPQDGVFAIPQTGHRPRHVNAGVEETPSRGFAKFMPKGLGTQPGTGTLDSPIARRTVLRVVEATPMKRLVGVEATPIKTTGLEGTPVRPPSAPLHTEGGEKNIYAALGWEDDAYEVLS